MVTLYRPNPHFERELVREPGYVQVLTVAAEAVADAVRALAPVRTGAYRDSIQVVVEGGKVRVETTDFAGHIIEWGSINQPPMGPLRRGARAAGVRLVESN